VQWTKGEGLENKHVERALEEISFGITHAALHLSVLGILANDT
jgi:hypothetical protein